MCGGLGLAQVAAVHTSVQQNGLIKAQSSSYSVSSVVPMGALQVVRS